MDETPGFPGIRERAMKRVTSFLAVTLALSMAFLADSSAAQPPSTSAAAKKKGDGAARKKIRKAMAGRAAKDKGPPAVVKTPIRKPGQRGYPAEVAALIDEAIDARLEEEDISASPGCSDAEFIRRVTLDVIGRIPTRERIAEFLADSGSDKRDRLIDELLASKEYGEHFGTIWYHLLIEPNDDNRRLISPAFGEWLAGEFNKNTGWDKIVFDILTAKGTRSENPATVFFLSHVEGAQRRELKPQEIAGAVTQRFLGIQYQCAECHNHPFTGFKQQDFWAIAAFFGKTEADHVNKRDEKQKTAEPSIMEHVPGVKPTIAIPESSLKPSEPKFPDSRQSFSTNKEASLRAAFASWCTGPRNKDFPKAAVNRMWGHFFGRGFVNPVDDFRPENPASCPEALDLLASEFAKGSYDLKHLIRVICATNAYQRTSDALPENKNDEKFFSHMAIKQMGSDVLYASLETALGERIARGNANEAPKKKGTNAGTKSEFLRFFNTSVERDFSVDYTHGVPQALRLMNGNVGDGDNPTLSKIVAQGGGTEKIIRELYLTTLCRAPTEKELAMMTSLASRSRTPKAGYAAVQWVLLNSSEFVLNH
jgi:hypothetical protein